MMKTKIFLLLCLACCLFSLHGSAQFTMHGRIEYERRTNLRRLWEGDDWMTRIAEKIKPFMTVYFNLDFDQSSSRYSPGREGEVPKMTWGLPPGADNEIVQNFQSSQLTAAKTFYEEKFLISDTLPRLKWRIESEVRSIAGYTCRKAVTRICDSVYVVAFYTDAIPVSGGPEQMGGLPGMILELAVPRLYTTWIATKVDVQAAPPGPASRTKGKPMSRNELVQTLLKSMQDWGKNAQRNIWWAML
jgi:GLPGLI family protein